MNTQKPSAWLVTGSSIYKDRAYISEYGAQEGAKDREDNSVVAPLFRVDLSGALQSAVTDLVMLAGNIRAEMKRCPCAESQWEGVPEMLDARVSEYRSVLAGIVGPSEKDDGAA